MSLTSFLWTVKKKKKKKKKKKSYYQWVFTGLGANFLFTFLPTTSLGRKFRFGDGTRHGSGWTVWLFRPFWGSSACRSHAAGAWQTWTINRSSVQRDRLIVSVRRISPPFPFVTSTLCINSAMLLNLLILNSTRNSPGLTLNSYANAG